MCSADPILLLTPEGATAECLVGALPALAALNGPWSLGEPYKHHVLHTSCEVCQQQLREIWSRHVVPQEVADSVEEFPETGAYGAALRERLAER